MPCAESWEIQNKFGYEFDHARQITFGAEESGYAEVKYPVVFAATFVDERRI